ncbi:MAG: prepilin-type N-terminal cleavage/methylation domain-containing protein [Patescibacteria group bacterium]
MTAGFTLIEMIIVVAILAIVSVIVLMAIGNPQPRARDTTRLADLDFVQNYVERHMVEEDSYPDVVDFDALMADFSTRYLTRFAEITDPSGNEFYYGLESDGYCLCAELEEPHKANSGPECSFSGYSHYCLTSFQ